MKGRLLTVAAGLLSLLALQAGGTGAATGQPLSHRFVPGSPADVGHFRFTLNGERGTLTVVVAFLGFGKWSWHVARSGGRAPLARGIHSGQYDQLAGGRGGHVEVRGHASAWYARLVGFVIPKGGPRQRVVIKLKSRPEGTFALIPAQPGSLKRDSGTQSSGWLG